MHSIILGDYRVWVSATDERYREAQLSLRRTYPMMVNKARAD